jgi:hypothetical protein
MMLRDARSQRGGLFSFAHVAPGGVRVVADHGTDGFASSAELYVEEGRSTEVTLVLSAAGGVRGTVVDIERRPVAGAFYLALVPDEATSLIAVARGYETAHVALANREDRAKVVVRIQLAAAPPVEGDVSGEGGEPIRAQIVACAGQPLEARVVSSEDGTFKLPASAIGCEAVAEQTGYAPSDPATVVSGRRVLLRLKAGGSIEGVVVDDVGAGVPSFTLGIESYSSARGRGGGGGGPRGFEDLRGAFRLDKLAPGSYVLTASAAGKPPARSDSIEVRAGVVTRGVRIVLASGGSVIGHVYDERHAPLADVEIGFDAVSSIVDGSAATKTDELGRYRLDGAPAGLFTLRVQKARFPVRLISGLRVASRTTLTEDLVLVTADAGLELTGIGANLRLTDDGIELAAVGTHDPAEHAGLQAGDRILRIDGERSDGMSVADAVQRLRGEVGTSVGLSVERPKTGETLDVTIVRATIVR